MKSYRQGSALKTCFRWSQKKQCSATKLGLNFLDDDTTFFKSKNPNHPRDPDSKFDSLKSKGKKSKIFPEVARRSGPLISTPQMTIMVANPFPSLVTQDKLVAHQPNPTSTSTETTRQNQVHVDPKAGGYLLRLI